MIEEIESETIKSVEEFITLVKKFNRHIFRGHRKESWNLVPKLGRDEKGKPLMSGRSTDDTRLIGEMRQKEIKYLGQFRLRLPAFGINFGKPYSGTNPSHEYTWIPLIIGQHYGLPTRLLDFTKNPLVACYFAVIGNSNEDSVVWCFDMHNITRRSQFEIYYTPPKFDNIYFLIINPANIDNRIPAQSSVFTFFELPNIPLERHCKVIKIVIPNETREEILKSLDILGINEETLFPDLTGICKHLSWKIERWPESIFP